MLTNFIDWIVSAFSRFFRIHIAIYPFSYNYARTTTDKNDKNVIIPDNNLNYCPVSSAIDLNAHGVHTYPLIFLPTSSNISSIEGRTYKCTAQEFSDKPVPYICMSKEADICPITSEQFQLSRVIDQTRKKKVTFSCNYMQHLNDTTKSDQPVTIRIIGGSVTDGDAGTKGCCCDPELDSTCPVEAGNKCKELSRKCGWVHYFTRWIEETFHGRILVKSHAIGGHTSLEYVLSNNGITRFHMDPHDILLIDMSANDYTQYDLRPHLSLAGLEAIIRKYTPSSASIFILEFWRMPFYPHHPIDSALWVGKSTLHKKDPTYLTYRMLAEHYRVPFLSYPDAFYTIQKHEGMSDKFTYSTQFKGALRGGNRNFPDSFNPHVQWFIHLHYADLIGAVLLDHFQSCQHFISQYTTKQLQQFSIKRSRLPPPLSTVQEGTLQMDCIGPETQPSATLSFDASNYLLSNTSNSQESGGFQLMQNSGWKFVKERKNKPGWIATYQNHSVDSNGKIPLRLTYKYKPKMLTRPSPYDYNDDISVRLQFLRTYHNAGAIEVFICGQSVGTIDALWGNFNSTRYSVATSAYIRFCDYKTKCPNLTPNDSYTVNPLLAASYSNNYDVGPFFISIDLVHKHMHDHIKVREYQKFKLISMSVCTESRACTRDFYNHANYMHIF